MKTRTIQRIILAIACICVPRIAPCQTSANDLMVSAEARVLLETNNTRIFLTVHLVNATDHELTVLTQGLDASTSMDMFGKQMILHISYANAGVKHDGHQIVPSLYALLPVRLKPNEEAFISKEIHYPKEVTPETQFVVRYTISSEWAKRFALWSGSAQSKPFSASIRKPQ